MLRSRFLYAVIPVISCGLRPPPCTAHQSVVCMVASQVSGNQGGITMQILLTGGTGLVGRALCRHFQQQGDSLVVLSRQPDKVAGLCSGARGIRSEERRVGKGVELGGGRGTNARIALDIAVQLR